MRDTAGLGALSTPGPAVLTRAGDNPRPAACRPSTARVLSPRHSRHPSGAASYEASVKGSRPSPARPSPHPWPPDDSGNPPAFPRAPHPLGQDPRTHAGAGTGSEHKPGTTPPALRHAGPPISEVHSQHVRPRVALIIWHVLATGTPYDELGADYFTRRLDPDRETRRLIAKLEALGHAVSLQQPPDHRSRGNPAPLALRRVLPPAQLRPIHVSGEPPLPSVIGTGLSLALSRQPADRSSVRF